MKRILGLDLGPNSIGWALVKMENDSDLLVETNHIEACGSRIIPMDAAVQGNFESGNSVSQTAERTGFRGIRRLRERCLLRRERLNRILDIMGFLPEHYAFALTRYGKFKDADGCKLAWRKLEAGKYEFLFKDSFNEMLADFRRSQAEWLGDSAVVPYDWTIYYLRKKALAHAITKQELAWILLNFNQKRGYYQLRGEEAEDKEDKAEEYYALKVVEIRDTGERKGKDTWFDIVLENGMVYHRAAPEAPDWIGKVKEFIVTTQLDNEGKPKLDKDGNVRRSFRMPKDDDWALLKKKTEADIDKSGKTVGAYIYDTLLTNPKQKIKGKLVRTVERKYYKAELKQILDSQKRFIPELNDDKLYEACIDELYSSNDAYRESILNRGFTWLFIDNIIFYQRPLKSKKSLIDDCPYETHTYMDKTTGEMKTAGVKCVAKSNPLYQEFRLWQFVANLRIYERMKKVDGVLRTDVDVTDEFLGTTDDRVRLFEWLNDRKDVTQEVLFGTFFGKKKPKGKDSVFPYRWNYVDKAYPCNETRGEMIKCLEKAGICKDKLTSETEKSLWHVLYSVDDKQELGRALETFADKHGFGEAFVETFAKFKPFEKEYGAYSEKAIKRLLPLLRMGKHWSADAIDEATRVRIDKIIDGEYDENIRSRVREKAMNLTDVTKFSGLPLWLACYVVYDRHSEAKDIVRWTSPDDIDGYLRCFKQHSMRNPIVEQVVTETLRTVRDIWRQHGRPDEVHIELGRDMKRTAEQRKAASQINVDNENANIRVKTLLTEFMNPEFGIDNVRPYSPSQQDLLRIYEDGVLDSAGGDIPDDISEIMKKLSETDVKRKPTHSEVLRYKLWLDQKYQSPYTGRFIPLARLFTSDYQIEHIIPQSRYFDDSFSNKVICEAAVNALKDKMLGMEFIKEKHGQKVELGNGQAVDILSVEEYERLVARIYGNNKPKMRKLLMDDLPDDFIARQLNDSRYISKMVKTLMSNIVREEGEQEDISKNVVTCNGTITDRLKKDWGAGDVWNRIVLPRFKRLNEITESNRFTTMSSNGHEIPDMPLELQKGFKKKRIDHRHHAMDAIVIACTTREHVNLLNNEAAMSKNNANRYQLSRKLRRYEDTTIMRNGEAKRISVAKEFLKPWPTLTADMEQALRGIVVSFKQNLRVINKTSNKYQHFEDGKKKMVHQVKGDSWAIRKSLHKETVFGEVNLRVIREVSLKEALKRPRSIVDKDLKRKIVTMLELGYDDKRIKTYFLSNKDAWHDFNPSKIKVYYFTQEILDKSGKVKDRYFATRKPLDTSFSRKRIEDAVTDTGIQKILLRHLDACGGDSEKAFSPEGIEAMNQDIVNLNNGKQHQPIYKVRVYEKADKYAVGKRGSKAKKFVEAAKGTNLFFAVYETEETDKATGLSKKRRTYATIPLYEAVRRAKEGLPVAPEDANGNSPAFVLSPNDLVYLPTREDIDSGQISLPLDKSRIYKMVSCTGTRLYGIPYNVANSVIDKVEFTQLNKVEFTDLKESIKDICVPLKVDRIGNIVELNGKKL